MNSRAPFDLLVVGAGPAGLAGAARAAEAGLRVGLVDDNPEVGGQIWRGQNGALAPAAAGWAERTRGAGVEVFRGARVFDHPAAGALRAERGEETLRLEYRRLLIATGARERFLPFPGWTLPNVMGAGGLQALVKGGLPIEGRRVVVAGSGPLLMAVAAYLRQHGAVLAGLCEQAAPRSLARFGASALRQPSKVRQGLQLQRAIGAVPVWASCWPLEARGEGKLESVVLRRGGGARAVACDYLACGFHLIPNTELAQLLGCATQNGSVLVNAWQETTQAEVYCAGEPTGVGGLELALVEGEIAGLAAAGRRGEAAARFAEREELRGFAAAMEAAFAPRPELRSMAAPETLVCRCEDVSLARIQAQGSWRAAKLQTRCGMGPCQGRVCGPAVEFLLGWPAESVRPPLFPAPIAGLCE